MIIPLAAITTAASLVNGFMNSRSQPAPPPKASGGEFSKNLNSEIGRMDQMNQANQISAIQSMIARQKATGTSRLDQQLALSQMLRDKTVQVQDSSGNNVVGKVTDVRFVNGDPHLSIAGRNYPMSSLQAILHGTNATR
jgi:hypothetical protein